VHRDTMSAQTRKNQSLPRKGGISKYMQPGWTPPLAEGQYGLSQDQLERLAAGSNEGLPLPDLAERVRGNIHPFRIATTLCYLSRGDASLWNPETVKLYLSEAAKAREQIADVGRLKNASLEKKVKQLVAMVPDVGYELDKPNFFGTILRIPISGKDVDAKLASMDFGSAITDALKESPPFIYLVRIQAGYKSGAGMVILSPVDSLDELEVRVTTTFLEMYRDTLTPATVQNYKSAVA